MENFIKKKTITIMSKRFWTSDTHYAHVNICRGTTRWGNVDEMGEFKPNLERVRDFNTIAEMNDAIVNAINSVVGEDDELIHGGDVSFDGIENLWNFRKRIKCKTIHLIYGNHDHHIKKNHVVPNCHWDSTEGIKIVDGPNPNIFGDDRDRVFDVHAQELFTSVAELRTIKIGKIITVVCHYPLEQWEEMDHGAFHIHGHCHGNLPETEYRRIDFGLDANGFAVVDDEYIIKKMSTKKHAKQHHPDKPV